MASKYWIKLYHEILNDPKMGRLSDNLWRRFIECCLLAGEMGQDGRLPSVGDIAWRLRMDDVALQQEFDQLSRLGFLEYRADELFDGYWFVVNFAKRQAPMDINERVKRHRESKKKAKYYPSKTEGVTTPVTPRYTEPDKDKDIDIEVKTFLSVTTDEMLTHWQRYFPDKTQPKPSTHKSKIRTRIKNRKFLEQWKAAIKKASTCDHLKSEGWFQFEYTVRNDENVGKILNGVFDGFTREHVKTPAKGGNTKRFAAARAKAEQELENGSTRGR